jgi:hypothetical protein
VIGSRYFTLEISADKHFRASQRIQSCSLSRSTLNHDLVVESYRRGVTPGQSNACRDVRLAQVQ